MNNLKIGLFGIGLKEYWSQFDGLKRRLEGYIFQLEENIKNPGWQIINFGMVDSIEKSNEASEKFRKEGVDILVLYVTTYAVSGTLIPLVRKLGFPILVLNLAPSKAINYKEFNALNDRSKMTGEWLAWCSACPVPEIANVFKRMSVSFHEIIGVLDDPKDECWTEINNWLEAAKVKKGLENNVMGLMGHYYNGMLDIQTDLTAISSVFGSLVQHFEVDELSSLRKEIPEDDLNDKLKQFREEFEIIEQCSDAELKRAARTSIALDQIVEKYGLTSLAYYYMGTGNDQNFDTMSSIILGTSLLTASGIPVAGEYEVKNCLAMKIMDLLGAGGSFSEFYAMDFEDDIVLMGHDGPGHTRISNGKAKVKPLEVYHGKVGKGLSIEMSVENGPVTLLSVIEGENRGFELLVAEGESVDGPILEIGNTNSRYKFEMGARQFVKAWNSHGPAHHCAIGVGHIASKLNKLAALLGMSLHIVK